MKQEVCMNIEASLADEAVAVVLLGARVRTESIGMGSDRERAAHRSSELDGMGRGLKREELGILLAQWKYEPQLQDLTVSGNKNRE